MSTILEQLRAFKDGFSQGGASRAEMAFSLTNAAPLGEVLEIAKQLDLRYEVEIITKTLLTRTRSRPRPPRPSKLLSSRRFSRVRFEFGLAPSFLSVLASLTLSGLHDLPVQLLAGEGWAHRHAMGGVCGHQAVHHCFPRLRGRAAVDALPGAGLFCRHPISRRPKTRALIEHP